jgi:hypothetical protein
MYLGFGPDERPGMLIVGFDEGIDVLLELIDRGERRALQRLSLQDGVADSEDDMQAPIAGAAAAAGAPLSFLLPTRQSSLFRWCLGQDLTAVKPMTLMTIGQYRTPDRPYMPSVFY